MKVKKLINLLSKEDPNAEVLTYVEEAEEYGETTSLETFDVNEKDNMPYAKSDVPDIKSKTVLIKGWIAQ